VWVILDHEISKIGAKVWVIRGSKIHTGGARKVIASVPTVFWIIF
jgi:hypothetical protein